MVKWDEKFRGEGLVIIQVYSDCHDSLDALRKHVSDKGIKYPVALDPGGSNSQLYLRRPAFPARCLVGHEGKVVWEAGPGSGVKAEDAEEAVRKAIEQAKAAKK